MPSGYTERGNVADRLACVTGGPQPDLDRNHEHANAKDVVIMGGGTLAHSHLDAGLVNVLVLHAAPVVLGVGTPLFPPASGDPAGTRADQLTFYRGRLAPRHRAISGVNQ